MTHPVHTCRRCGGATHPEATRGLCPVCLLETTLKADADPETPDLIGTALPERHRLAEPLPPDRQPQSLGDYELLEEIGRGGMGVIYRARQVSLDRFVAVKTVLTGPLASRDFVERFRTEAHAAAVLDHRNIVPIYEVGQHLGQPFYSMRLVPGRNLAQELSATGAMPPRRAAELLATVAHAVHYAHQRGVLHRDLKPANILLDADGGPQVTDFGLAKLLEQDDGLTLTQAALGTPNYMAPEQADGDGNAPTTAADVYSLGAVLFELLTGQKLFGGSSPLTTISRAREQEPPRPSDLSRGVPRDLDTICWKCLEKEPRRRYASALALAEDLERWLKGEPIQARQVGRVERLGLWCRRKPALATMAGAALLAVILVSGLAAWRVIVAREQKQLEQYAANISLADSYVRDGATDRAMELLLQCPERFRHWEWGRLVYMCNQEVATIPAHTNRPRMLDEPNISSLTVNRPGTRLATKGNNGEFRLWSLPDGRRVFLGDNSTNEVTAWDFSPDGRQMVYGTVDGALASIDAETGQPAWSLPSTATDAQRSAWLASRRIFFFDLDPQDTRPVYLPMHLPETVAAVACFPDGRQVLIAKGNGDLLVLDSQTGVEQARWRHHLAGLEAIWFTPDGARLLVKGTLGVQLFDPASGLSIATNLWPETTTSKLFVDHTGRSAVSFDVSGAALLWRGGQVVSTFPDYPARLMNSRAAFFDPSGRWVCMTGDACLSGVFERETGRFAFALNQHVNGAAFTEDGRRLVTFGPDRSVRLWDVEQRRELRILRGHQSVPNLAAFTADGRFAVTASREGVVKLWTAFAGREMVQAASHAGVAAFTPDGRQWAASPAWNGTFVYDSDTGGLVAEFPLQRGGPVSMAFSPDSRYLVTVGSEKVARIWDLRERQPAGLLRGHDRAVWCVDWSADGRWIATGDWAGVVRIWDASSRREERRIQALLQFLKVVRFDPAARKLLTAGYGRPKVWDLETGKLLWELDDEKGGCYWGTFSPNGRWIVFPCTDGKIRFWDAATGKLAKRWTTRGQGWAFCGFTPDSRRLVVPVMDHGTLGFAAPFIQVWDVDRGRHVLDLRGHIDSVFGAIFNPSGTRVLTAGMDYTVRQWESFPWKNSDYRAFPGERLAQRIQSYADRYWHDRAAAEHAAASIGGPEIMGGANTPTPREWEQILRPVRAPDTPSHLLNLDAVYTGALEGVFRPDGAGSDSDDDLTELPKGIVPLQGTSFDIRGVVQLRLGAFSPDFWQGWLDHPTRVDGIPVGTKFHKLHVLHATVGTANPSTVVGTYTLHFTDGSQQELEIVYGRHLRNWWHGGRGDPEKEASHAALAWVGSNPVSRLHGTQIRLFHCIYDNPRPDLEVVSVSFASRETAAAPFLVAMTVEP